MCVHLKKKKPNRASILHWFSILKQSVHRRGLIIISHMPFTKCQSKSVPTKNQWLSSSIWMFHYCKYSRIYMDRGASGRGPCASERGKQCNKNTLISWTQWYTAAGVRGGGADADLWTSVPLGRETTFEHGLVLISMGGIYDHLAAGSCHFSIKAQSAAFSRNRH